MATHKVTADPHTIGGILLAMRASCGSSAPSDVQLMGESLV
ncbi:hypothetical protein [Mycolicibacterium peregrinum]|nr:hypothetical protein [Mycolicibacterium peregrinum]